VGERWPEPKDLGQDHAALRAGGTGIERSLAGVPSYRSVMLDRMVISAGLDSALATVPALSRSS
jgi:hypothetical protein